LCKTNLFQQNAALPQNQKNKKTKKTIFFQTSLKPKRAQTSLENNVFLFFCFWGGFVGFVQNHFFQKIQHSHKTKKHKNNKRIIFQITLKPKRAQTSLDKIIWEYLNFAEILTFRIKI